MTTEERDVVVVGAGPVGLTIASVLDSYGIKTTIIDKKTTLSPLAKSTLLTGRSLEHFRGIGLEEAVLNAAYPRDMPVHFTSCTNVLHGHYFFNERFSSWGEIVDGRPNTKFAFHQEGASVCAPLLCPQPALERVIKQHLEGRENVEILWGWEVQSVSQDEEEVMVRAVKGGEGEEGQTEEKSFRAKFVVACDGGRSFVRKALNVHTYGKFVVGRALSIMFKSEELFARQCQMNVQGFSVVTTDHFLGALETLNTKGEFALNVFVPENASDEQIEKYVCNPSHCVVTVAGDNIQHTITAISKYHFHAILTTKFRVGRCLFAGDSAHQWLPTGGLGLNTGVGDALNLAWKLTAVLKGYGGPYLLDSYEVEQKPLCDSTRRFTTSFGKGSLIGSTIKSLLMSNPLTRSLLSYILKYSLTGQYANSLQLVFAYQYINSNVVVHEYDTSGALRVNPSTMSNYIPTTHPGLRAPHVALPDSKTILDLFGKKFVLLVIGGEETDCRALREELEQKGVPLATYAYPKLPELVALYNRKYFLIRPDGIIVWCSDTQPNKVKALKITRVITGDIPPGRVPPRVLMKPKPSSPIAPFVFDMLSSIGLVGLLQRFTQLPFKTTVGAGLGLFWLMRMLRTHPLPQNVESTGRHMAAVVKQFGSAEQALQIEPKFMQKFGPKDVLIRVHAASVNPTDVKTRQGATASLLHRVSRLKGTSVFPLLLGRDCSGEIVAVGDDVTKFVTGDQVYGVCGFGRGTYAQLVPIAEDSVALKPTSLEHREAAAIPFVAVTVYTALVENVGLNESNARGKKVLVHGGTGGVGSFAVQLLKAWGAEVTVTCSKENIPLAHSLGADKAFDYKQGDFSKVLDGFDVVLDTIGFDYERPSLRVLKMYAGASYVTLVPPYLPLLSKFGPILGSVIYSWLYRFKIILNRIIGGRAFYYSIANPNGQALEMVSEMVQRGEIRPLIDAVYSLDEIIAAHQHVEDGHTRGKVIVTMP